MLRTQPEWVITDYEVSQEMSSSQPPHLWSSVHSSSMAPIEHGGEHFTRTNHTRQWASGSHLASEERKLTLDDANKVTASSSTASLPHVTQSGSNTDSDRAAIQFNLMQCSCSINYAVTNDRTTLSPRVETQVEPVKADLARGSSSLHPFGGQENTLFTSGQIQTISCCRSATLASRNGLAHQFTTYIDLRDLDDKSSSSLIRQQQSYFLQVKLIARTSQVRFCYDI